MSRGWGAVTVTHELAVVTDGTAGGGRPTVEVDPGTPMRIDVLAVNHGDVAQPGLFQLVGLGPPLATVVSAIESTGVPEPRTLEFAMPARLNPGRNPVTVEWIRVGGARTEHLAVADLVVVVDDVASARIEVTPRLVKGLLGAKAKVLLENTGTGTVQLALSASTPRGSRVGVHLTPESVRLESGQLCHAIAHVHRRARWLGSSRTHVFDIHARAASGTVTGTGTYRQYTVFPPMLFKAGAAVAAIVLAMVLLLRLVRAVVDDDAPSTWESVAEAPEDLVARVGHTATWMTFERRDASTGRDGALARTRELITGIDDSVRGVLVWGGDDAEGRSLATGGIYSVTDGTWLTVAPLPGDEGRSGHTAVWTGERVVIWGGAVTVPGQRAAAVVPTEPTPLYGAEYDPTEDDWDALPPSGLEPRIGHSMIWTGRELIVFGGIAADGRVLSDGGILRAGRVQGDGTSTADDEADLSAGVWSLFEVGDLGPFAASPRAFHSAAWDGRYMVITGGLAADGTLLSDAYAYDVARNRWNLVSLPLFEPRACHRSVATGAGVVILGGLGAQDLADTDRVARAVEGGFCDGIVSATRPDPVGWNLALAPNPDDPRAPEYTWTVLADAPEHLGTDFEVGWTGSAVGIALLVPELDSIAPITYVPGEGTTIGALPEQGQLDVRSDLTAEWYGSELFVWGGRGERACGLGDDEPGCPAQNGAVLDVGP